MSNNQSQNPNQQIEIQPTREQFDRFMLYHAITHRNDIDQIEEFAKDCSEYELQLQESNRIILKEQDQINDWTTLTQANYVLTKAQRSG